MIETIMNTLMLDSFFNDFHLLRPWWLLAIIPAVLVYVLCRHHRRQQSGWNSVLPAHLAELLIDSRIEGQGARNWRWLLLGWILMIFALSGPTWQKLPQPLFEVNRGKVLVLDMSLSMYATDIAPNRLTRARFKTVDLLKRLPEGETGLVAFAGDGFVISPLTTDINNLLNLLPALSPEIMPALGSEAQHGIEKARDLLGNAGYQQGDIFLITDGVDTQQRYAIDKLLEGTHYRLSVLGVGTQKAAPIKLPDGQLLKDNSGNIVLPKVDHQLLASLASYHQGTYSPLTLDDGDIDSFSAIETLTLDSQQSDDQFGDGWYEAGPWLLLLLLPFASLAFRRGLLVCVISLSTLQLAPAPVMANTTQADEALATPAVSNPAVNTPASNATDAAITDAPLGVQRYWQQLWKTDDQRGAQHFEQQQFDQAAETFQDNRWQGASHYRRGDYEAALDAFQQQTDATGHYNQGNALAHLGRYDEAIEQYKNTLKQAPDHEDAKQNIEVLEKLKQQQQEQQNQQQQDGDQQDGQQQDGQQQDGQQQDGQQQDGQQQDGQQQDGQQQDGQQQDGQQQDEQQQDGQQQDEQERQQQAEQQQAQEQEGQQQEGQQQEGQQAAGHFDPSEFSQEQRQHLNKLMNKIPDDPALLLRNKMRLEAQKRRRQGVAVREKQNW